MNPATRTQRQEKIAKIYDQEILPLWSERFGRLLLRDLDVSNRQQVLNVACGTGFLGVEIARGLPDGGRLIAIDNSSAMLDIARKKFEKLGAKNVFFRTEEATPHLPFADDVYDLVVCNLGSDVSDREQTLAEFARVTRPGGEVRCTLAAANTFQQFLTSIAKFY